MSNIAKCGCNISRKEVKNNIKTEAIKLDCPATFETITRNPLGIFQLEGPTAKKWITKFNPQSILEISDFTSLARTGPLEVGMMAEYIAVKNGEKEADYIHEKLKPILERTRGTLVYQEQILEICRDIAHMSLGDADLVRKAVGKKDAKLMAECKASFVDGCAKNQIDKDIADKIWSWIDAMSGYSFNLSHACCYTYIAYKSAWLKTHFPVEFFTALLRKSGSGVTEQGEEVRAILNDAKLYDIAILPPSVKRGNLNFEIVNDKTITFGLGSIKGIGAKGLATIKKIHTGSHNNILTSVFTEGINKTVFESLIWSGAFDDLKVSRTAIEADYKILSELTAKELPLVLAKLTSENKVRDVVWNFTDPTTLPYRKEKGEDVPMEKRCVKIRQFVLENDKFRRSANYSATLAREKILLGVTLSGNETDLHDSSYASDNCIEFVDAPNDKKFKFLAILEEIRLHTDKKGNTMAFIKFSDSTYMIDGGVVFSKTYKKCIGLIAENRVVLLKGKKQDNSFLVDDIMEV